MDAFGSVRILLTSSFRDEPPEHCSSRKRLMELSRDCLACSAGFVGAIFLAGCGVVLLDQGCWNFKGWSSRTATNDVVMMLQV